MNFKTTIVLLVALLVVGGVLAYTQIGQKKAPESQSVEQTTPGQGQKLMDVQSDQVKSLTITDADGNHTTLEKKDAAWRMTEPVDAAAVDWQTQDFIRTICDLRSQGRPETAPSDSGLDNPKYIVSLTTEDGNTVRLDIGDKTPLGDEMYARVGDGEVNLIDSSLAKTLKTAGSDLRDKHLLTVSSPMEVQQVRIITPAQRLVMQRQGTKWQITEPVRIPGDSDAISSLISTITETEATEFVPANSDELAFAGFEHPTMQIWLSTKSPTTRPATNPSAFPEGGQSLTIGSPDSLARDHYFAQTSDGLVAKIASSALDELKKTPLDLRDRDVATILPEDVTQISVVKEMYSTTATKETNHRPVATQLIVLQRRAKTAEKLGPVAPAKLRGGARPSTQPATKPSTPQSVWEFGTGPDKHKEVDDSKVDDLLQKFDPLKADSYLPKKPASAAMTRYLVTIHTKAQKYQFELVRPVNDETPYGIYNGLTFEVASPTVDALDADFHKTGS